MDGKLNNTKEVLSCRMLLFYGYSAAELSWCNYSVPFTDSGVVPEKGSKTVFVCALDCVTGEYCDKNGAKEISCRCGFCS